MWCQVSGPKEVYWWKSGTLHTQWDPPWDPDGVAAAVHRRRLGFPGMRTVGVPQTQFLIVVDWLELDKLKQEASSGRWRRRMVTTACHGTDDSTDFWKVQHSWE